MTAFEQGFIKRAQAYGINPSEALYAWKQANFGQQPPHAGGPAGGPKPPGGPQPGGHPGGPQPGGHPGGPGAGGGAGGHKVTIDGQELPPEIADIVVQLLGKILGGGQGGGQPGGHPGAGGRPQM